jgi:hypothetical protein
MILPPTGILRANNEGRPVRRLSFHPTTEEEHRMRISLLALATLCLWLPNVSRADDKPDPKFKKVKWYKCVRGTKKVKKGLKEKDSKTICVENTPVKVKLGQTIEVETQADALKTPLHYAVMPKKLFDHFKKNKYRWQCDNRNRGATGGLKNRMFKAYYVSPAEMSQSEGNRWTRDHYKKKKQVADREFGVIAFQAASEHMCKYKEHTCQWYSDKTKMYFGRFKAKIDNCQ